jgi:phosphoglycerate dehydrogenase-like enzyme
MPITVLYPEADYPDDSVERRIFGPDARIIMRKARAIGELSDEDCAGADGLMLRRLGIAAAEFTRFTKLRCVVRMGVGYDSIARKAAAERQIMVCNVPDYGTTEVADHAIAMVLALRRGLLLHHEWQRQDPPAPWVAVFDPMIRRLSTLTFGVVGLGRIGTAAALRAKAFGFRVVFFDPYRPNGSELALGIERARTLQELLRLTDTLSLHTPLTPETRGMIGATELGLMPRGSVLVNTALGPVVDIDALPAALQSGQLAGAALDRAGGGTAGRPGAGTGPRLSCPRKVGRGTRHHHAALGISRS